MQGRKRLKPESLAVKIGDLNISHSFPIPAGDGYLQNSLKKLRLTQKQMIIAESVF